MQDTKVLNKGIDNESSDSDEFVPVVKRIRRMIIHKISEKESTTQRSWIWQKRTSRNLWGEWMGVMHGDEVEYVFGHPLNASLKYTDKEAELSLRMIRYFTQFANEGAPMVEEHMWPPYTRDQPRYYIFNAEKISLEKGLRPTACAFWNEFLPRLKGAPDPVPEACNSAIASSVSAGAQEIRNTALITALLLLPALTISKVM